MIQTANEREKKRKTMNDRKKINMWLKERRERKSESERRREKTTTTNLIQTINDRPVVSEVIAPSAFH